MSDEIIHSEPTFSTPEPLGTPEDSYAPVIDPITPAAPAEEDSDMDDFVTEEPAPDLGIDPSNVVTIRTSSGQSHYVAVTDALTLGRIKEKSGLTYGAGTQFFLNNTVINDGDTVPMGATLTAVGSVKGG